MVEALRYKPGISRVRFRLRPHYGPGVDSACDRHGLQEYLLVGKGDRCVGLRTLPTYVPIVLKSESLNLLEPSGSLQAYIGIALPFRSIR